MAVPCGPDDIVQLVDAPTLNAQVLVDFNSSPIFYDNWEAPPAPNRGPLYLAGHGDDRVLEFDLNVEKTAEINDVMIALQPAIQLIARGEVWLKFQKSGASGPVFFKLHRSDITSISEFWTVKARTVHVALRADAYSRGLLVTEEFTIRNTPVSGTNPMQVCLDDIQGDVMTPLILEFPDPDNNHTVKWASEAIYTDETPTLVYDDFNRPDTTGGVGDPVIGPTPTQYAGQSGIINHKAYFPTDTASYVHLAYDVGTPDVTIETKIDVINGANNTALIFARSASLGNGIYLGATQLFRVSASTPTPIDTLDAQIFPGDTVRMTLDGDDIKVWVQRDSEGEFVLISEVIESTFNTVESHGYGVFGTSGDTARFASFKIVALSTACRSTPYWKSLWTSAKRTTDTDGWVFTDSADSTADTGSKRRAELPDSFGADAFSLIHAAELVAWNDLLPGDYRVFVRAQHVTVESLTTLYFFNQIPSNGVTQTPDDAAIWTTLGSGGASGWDWYDLGVAALPGGSPQTDTMFGLTPLPNTALWNLGIQASSDDDFSTIYDLDVIVLVPAGRPGTITRHGSVTYPDEFTGKTAFVDGVNQRRYFVGETSLAAGVDVAQPPEELTGAAPMVLPRAVNTLTFFITTRYSGASQTNIEHDDKNDTTLVSVSYFPMYVNDRPPTT